MVHDARGSDSALRRREILTRATVWTNLEDLHSVREPVTSGQILCDSTHTRSLEWSDSQTGSGQWCQALGEGMGSECLVGTEVQFGKMEISGDGGVGGYTTV